MDADEGDYVFFGTPIEREEEMTSRKKKAIAVSSGNLRSLPPWKQEVTDEEGRRRFHGAFTGGFSAGYYNTVGSKEGWVPQAFTSSRKNRAEVKKQSIFNFLDDDEKAEMEGHSLATSLQFDTFGFTSAELARKQAEKEQQQRPSAIPGPLPVEMVIPATESIGIKLLLKMGWRRGKSIKDSHTSSLYDARREARKAFLALSSDDVSAELAVSEGVKSDLQNVGELPANDDHKSSESTPVYVLNPKQDLHGLGYDPFKHAPEFREKKRLRISGKKDLGHRKGFSTKDDLFAFKSGKVAPGFGIGALEEPDVEDEDVYASGYEYQDNYVQEVDEPSGLMSIDNKQKLGGKEKGVLPGFKVASKLDYQLERFDPPVVPKDFVTHHKFPTPLGDSDKHGKDPPPPETIAPEDNNLKLLIEGVATLVARCGKLFEDLSREKNQSNPLFSFLTGGNGCDYYARKLWEERQKHNDKSKELLNVKSSPTMQKMTAESRGKILGEKPLERSFRDTNSSVASADVPCLQFNLSDTFTTPASLKESPEIEKPFQEDPAKQERFELFLKEKYQGGLRSTSSSGASNMSEAARARERLDFEAAAEAIEKGLRSKKSSLSTQQFMAMSATAAMQFTPGGLEQAKVTQAEELVMKKMYPKREEFQWRPSPILCKRFDINDPYMGKPPPAPRRRSKVDSLVFTSDSVKSTTVDETVTSKLPIAQLDPQRFSEDLNDKETEVNAEVEKVERPVDLYKAIFSDDSDEEVENCTSNQADDPQKKIEAANTTLNRLMAGDFLESLGKELGLEVPPDMPESLNRARTGNNVNPGNITSIAVENKPPSISAGVKGTSINLQALHDKGYGEESTQEAQSLKNEPMLDNPNVSKIKETGGSGNEPGKIKAEKTDDEGRKAKTPTSHRQHWSSDSSSEDERERSRKRSRRHRRRSGSSDTDSSSDDQDRYHSRSKGRKKGSREKNDSSRKHSKHHKHGSKDSTRRSSHHSQERERSESKREKRR